MNEEWLKRMAEIEDECGSVSVGGLYHKLRLFEKQRLTNWLIQDLESHSVDDVAPELKNRIDRLREWTIDGLWGLLS